VTSPPASILCFGEILWDFLPDGLHAGGAPFNVAYHLHRLGQPTRVVSAVGADVLGDELLRRLGNWGLPTDGVARVPDRPTGYVRATVGPDGDARYEIAADVAWDRIAVDAGTHAATATARALVFGSLAQRAPANRAALERLRAALPAAALRIFDVNLRPPHDDLDLVRALARHATVLKLNAVEVVDTVGAGDAFLAALVAHLLTGRLPDSAILARACRLGEWVATRRGATPAYDSSTPL
jgi:fructokinase